MTTTEAFNEPTAPVAIQRSPWHSPVPYLFGGLAAMLGLIAFALLILACSYWKLSGSVGSDDQRDIEAAGEAANSEEKLKEPATTVFVEKLVIMAGQEKPTFLATPISSRASSFGSSNCCNSTDKSDEGSEKGSDGPLQNRNTVTREASDQVP